MPVTPAKKRKRNAPAPAAGKTDPRVDAYLAKSNDFAKPILAHLRAVVHKACPQATETVKWGMPFFLHQGILAFMAAFKAHCAFGIWKGGRVLGRAANENREAMGHLGRIESLKDLPKDSVIIGWVQAIVALNEAGGAVPDQAAGGGTRSAKGAKANTPGRSGKIRKPAKDVKVPDYFQAALKRNKRALAQFAGFTPGKRSEYVDWITEAKTEETRAKRLATAVEWISEGKVRNWKYITK